MLFKISHWTWLCLSRFGGQGILIESWTREKYWNDVFIVTHAFIRMKYDKTYLKWRRVLRIMIEPTANSFVYQQIEEMGKEGLSLRRQNKWFINITMKQLSRIDSLSYVWPEIIVAFIWKWRGIWGYAPKPINDGRIDMRRGTIDPASKNNLWAPVGSVLSDGRNGEANMFRWSDGMKYIMKTMKYKATVEAVLKKLQVKFRLNVICIIWFVVQSTEWCISYQRCVSGTARESAEMGSHFINGLKITTSLQMKYDGIMTGVPWTGDDVFKTTLPQLGKLAPWSNQVNYDERWGNHKLSVHLNRMVEDWAKTDRIMMWWCLL